MRMKGRAEQEGVGGGAELGEAGQGEDHRPEVPGPVDCQGPRAAVSLCPLPGVCPGGNQGRLSNAHGAGGKTLGEGASVSAGNRTVTHTEISTLALRGTPLARPGGGECGACGLEKVGFSLTEGGRERWDGAASKAHSLE